MRNSLLVLLLPSVAAPAMATSGSDTGGQSRRELMRANAAERAAARAEQRQESEAQAEPQEQARPGRRESRRAPAGPIVQPREVVERRGAVTDQDEQRSPDAPLPGRLAPRRGQEQADNLDSVRDWRRSERDQLRDVRVGTRPGSRPSPVIRPPRGARPDVQAPAPARVSRHRDSRSWHREWRGDRRYDWRRYRDRNRWTFNLGYYYDPFGWSYRRYPVGWRLWPSYYGYDHWLQDPWRYRLPPAFGPYRWVRYWDDALLVDIHSGQVVDVIHDFFW